MGDRPLSGLKVLDLTRLLPGPYLSLLLADMGSDVVKVEAPGAGDWVRWLPPLKGGLSTQFIALNRGKRSITLNLKSPNGADVLKRLASEADVLLESFRPGVMDRLGVGYDVLSRVNPALVYVAVTGYGQTGPYQQRAGHDLNYASLGGALGLTGNENGPPVMAGFQLADISGALYGAVGALAAIYERQRTGQGQFVDVSLCESALSFNVLTLARELNGDGPIPRGTDRLGGGAACYQVYECKDGAHFTVAALEPKFFQGFCDAVEKPEWKHRQMGQEDALRADIAALFKTRTRTEWNELFAAHDVCCEPVLTLEEVTEHPLHTSRKNFFDLPQPGSDDPVSHMRTPLLDPESIDNIAPAPMLGAHTREVLIEYGFNSEEIDQLAASGTISA